MGTRIICSIIILLFLTDLQGQSLRSSLKKAKYTFYNKDYTESLKHAKQVLSEDSLILDALYIGGESASQLRNFELAVQYLSRIPDHAKKGTYSNADFTLGLALKSLGKYDEASKRFQRYTGKSAKNENDLLSLLAAEELESIQWAKQQKLDNELTNVEGLKKEKGNSQSEYAPVRYADKIYFSSAHDVEGEEYDVSRIFTRTLNYPPSLFPDNPRRTDINASNVALTPDGRQMYFTICRDEAYYAQNRCEIWTMKKDYNGKWQAPIILPYPINARGFTTTQPSIGWDKSLKSFVLFFVSDRPGGKGKLDIWYVTIDREGNYGEPKLLPFNTPHDDLTPFFHQASQTLFFSSNGLPGLGGLDIFQCVKKWDGTWTTPENMGAPVNTSHDDLYYSWNMGAQRAYFSSNRNNTDCPDAHKGDLCTDIYEAEIFVSFAIIANDASDNTAIENFTIQIESPKEKLPSQTFNTTKGTHPKIILSIGRKYEVTVSAKNYEIHQFEFDATQLTKSEYVEKKVLLKKQKEANP